MRKGMVSVGAVGGGRAAAGRCARRLRKERPAS
jgi:hypothetical protein